MTDKLRFDNKVVVITGSGSGLGRSYAFEFAKRGAKLVINDLGGSVSGVGNSKNSADATVEDLRALGAEAVANYDSVEFGDRVIKTAIDCFGRVDVVINNAGIFKEVPFFKMTHQDWDQMLKVHLKGSFSVSKAAWSHMRKQKFGRIINTASSAGLYGQNNQANYAAAKLGVHGLTQTLAKEGVNYNICVNSIVPMAASRLTQDTFMPDLLELVTPERISPVVLYLAHESCTETGALYEVTGGWVTRLRWERAKGVFFPAHFTAEDLKKEWKKVGNFEHGADYPSDLTHTLQKAMGMITQIKPKI
jgi:NAD(P)-dependent dehydrogenase (short-subunit alcohol dehydrogenase family)